MKPILLPSLLAADFSELREELQRVEAAGVTHLHLDVMDGHFVPNLSFGPGLIQSLRPHTSLFFDAHLMVEEPGFLYEAFAEAGCQLLTIQVEAVTHLHRELQRIRSLGMQAGVALNPSTPPSVLEYVLDEVDLILVMSVNPGFGGQSFIPSARKKLAWLRQRIAQSGRSIRLEVDGGIKLDNVETVLEAGADWIVAGSSVFVPGKTEENARAFLAKFEQYAERRA